MKYQFLLNCLRKKFSPTGGGGEEVFKASNAQWMAVVPRAVSHGVAPILYHFLLEQGGSLDVPAETMRQLREQYRENSERNAAICNQLSLILRTLHDNAIPVILLKGAFLANVVYGDRALRTMSDIDLLVRREHLNETEKLLSSIGYCPTKDLYHSQDWTRDWHLANLHHLPAYSSPGNRNLEIHFHILPPPLCHQVEIEEMWRRAIPVQVAGIDALAFSPEDLIIHLCIHIAAGHDFGVPLRSFCDIAECIRYYCKQLDWSKLQAIVAQNGLEKFVYCTLILSTRLFESTLPEEVLEQANFHIPGPFLLDQLQETVLELPLNLNSTKLAEALAKEGIWERIKAISTLALSSRTHTREYYGLSSRSPARTVYFYTFLHLFRSLRRNGMLLLSGRKSLGATVKRARVRGAIRQWLALGSKQELGPSNPPMIKLA